MTIAEPLAGDVVTALDSLASGVDPRLCVATFDLRLGLVVGDTFVPTIQSHVKGKGVRWARDDGAEPEIVARVGIAGLEGSCRDAAIPKRQPSKSSVPAARSCRRSRC